MDRISKLNNIHKTNNNRRINHRNANERSESILFQESSLPSINQNARFMAAVEDENVDEIIQSILSGASNLTYTSTKSTRDNALHILASVEKLTLSKYSERELTLVLNKLLCQNEFNFILEENAHEHCPVYLAIFHDQKTVFKILNKFMYDNKTRNEKLCRKLAIVLKGIYIENDVEFNIDKIAKMVFTYNFIYSFAKTKDNHILTEILNFFNKDTPDKYAKISLKLIACMPISSLTKRDDENFRLLDKAIKHNKNIVAQAIINKFVKTGNAARLFEVNLKDAFGNTSLDTAIYFGNSFIFNLLLDLIEDQHLIYQDRYRGHTSLHYAIYLQREQMALALAQRMTADMFLLNNKQNANALHMVIDHNLTECAYVIIDKLTQDYPASLVLRDLAGYTALDGAIFNLNLDIVRRLTTRMMPSDFRMDATSGITYFETILKHFSYPITLSRDDLNCLYQITMTVLFRMELIEIYHQREDIENLIERFMSVDIDCSAIQFILEESKLENIKLIFSHYHSLPYV